MKMEIYIILLTVGQCQNSEVNIFLKILILLALSLSVLLLFIFRGEAAIHEIFMIYRFKYIKNSTRTKINVKEFHHSATEYKRIYLLTFSELYST